MGRPHRGGTPQRFSSRRITIPVEPRPAASVIVLREGRIPFEVLMVERNRRGMFGSLVVFPGGVTDEDDVDPRNTALRELREETGIDRRDAGSLVLISRWVTPRIAPQRFDTMFYLLEVVGSVVVVVDGEELVGHAWVTPEEALGLAEAGTWAMILPTLSHLRWLARRSSIADAMSAARGADGSSVIEPTRLDDGTLLPVFRAPGDS